MKNIQCKWEDPQKPHRPLMSLKRDFSKTKKEVSSVLVITIWMLYLHIFSCWLSCLILLLKNNHRSKLQYNTTWGWLFSSFVFHCFNFSSFICKRTYTLIPSKYHNKKYTIMFYIKHFKNSLCYLVTHTKLAFDS